MTVIPLATASISLSLSTLLFSSSPKPSPPLSPFPSKIKIPSQISSRSHLSLSSSPKPPLNASRSSTISAPPLISSTHPSLNLSHPTPDSFTWNTIIRAHSATQPTHLTLLSIYLRMRLHSVRPDYYTFPFLLQSFSSPPDLHHGRQVHVHALLSGLISDSFVHTSLINMYVNCGSFNEAHQVFDEIPHPDLPSWNSIISAYLKWGFIDVACRLFYDMPERNVVSWSCMIDGFVKCGEYRAAIELFREMQKTDINVRPNEFTMSSVLSACGKLGSLEHGKWAHAYIDKCEMKLDSVLLTSLIDMYAKCGSIERAKWVFDKNYSHGMDVMAWSAMISGFAMHGHSKECLDLFEKMLRFEVRPNAITFLGVLCGCVHGGLVDEGQFYFEKMNVEFGITPLIQHYGCLVDLYGRAGLIDKAWDVEKSMPMKPDVLIWGSLLSASRMHGDIKTCEFSLMKLIELEPMNTGAYVLLSNVYAKMGRWEKVRHVRSVMEEKGVKKVPGCSMVEVGGVLCEFFVGDETHPETKQIYEMLGEIMRGLKMAGYVGISEEILLDLDEE